MTGKVVDFNIYRLQRAADRALASGNPFESYCLEELIRGYEDGLFSITWERGEPIFAAITMQAEMESLNVEKS